MESLLATNSTFNSTLLSVVIASTSTASASMLDTTTVSATPLLVTSLTHAAAAISKSIKQSKSIKYNNDFSPVTLAGDWSRMGKLLILAIFSIFGSVGNIFMISSVMVEDHLKKAGNAFIASVALADLLVSSVLIFSSVIVLLAGVEATLAICRMQWFCAACAFLVTILSLAMTAFENYLRLCTPQDSPSWFNKRNTTTILLFMWFMAALAAGLQNAFNIGFDYCTQQWRTAAQYQAIIFSILIILPLVLTFYTHVRIIIDVKRFMSTPNFKPSQNYTWDLSLARTNFYSFLIFVAFWLPFGIVLSYHTTTTVSKRTFYMTAWFGLIKSCFHNVIYCATNRHFRNAYVNLFHYCCCKTTVSVSRRQRNEVCRPTSDVRVHIIPGYNMYSYTSPQRSGNCYNYWNKRDMHEL